ncbi:hypothetical protein BGZ72_005788 [Mortierella alpina]|nr:hypothetical protein BGZ72_005788 [Mortierella alpina]
MTQQIAQEVWKLQKQMNDRLILIQSKTEAILTQQLELAEYPIPRLFIVLPEEPVKYDPANWFRTKFRLYFICECGKHTEASDSKITHHLHVAKHEGYLVREPTVFFKKYGPFLLLMLELIKVGTSVAGHVVPALATLQAIELADSVKQSVELITAKIDLSLECIDRQLTKVQTSLPDDSCDSESPAAMTPQDLSNYLNNVEGLEGVELRQLGSFLKTSQEDSLLGNLYRMVTSDGHVKWVCRDHYRASYQEKQVERLREVVKLAKGEFDEQLGKITITLRSSIEAIEFYTAVSKAKGVLELDITLRGECDRSDLDALETVLRDSRVAIVRLLPTYSQYGALDRIKDLLQMREFHIELPKDFVKVPSFLSKTSSRLCKLSMGLAPKRLKGKESQALVEALKINSTLTSLNLSHNSIDDNEGQALAEALKINMTLTFLNLSHNSMGDNTVQALAEALKINSTLTNLGLSYNSIGYNGGPVLAEALKINRTLTRLNLMSNSIGDNAGQALAEALKVNKSLTFLDLSGNVIGDSAGHALAEALKINRTLTVLDLMCNSIGDNAGQALAEALKVNSSLIFLDLRKNSIRDKTGQALAEALKINRTLIRLYLMNNSIGVNARQALREASQLNPTLTALWL